MRTQVNSLYWAGFVCRVTVLGLIAGTVFAFNPVMRWCALFLITLGEASHALYLRYTRRPA